MVLLKVTDLKHNNTEHILLYNNSNVFFLDFFNLSSLHPKMNAPKMEKTLKTLLYCCSVKCHLHLECVTWYPFLKMKKCLICSSGDC